METYIFQAEIALVNLYIFFFKVDLISIIESPYMMDCL